jgi:DNA ligase-1
VWEIKAADLTSSPVHTACRHFNGQGISLRFPRLVRVREDKRAFDATTPRQMYQMYLEQPSVAKLGSKRPRGK